MTTYGKIQKSPRRIGGKKTEYGYKLLKEHTYVFCTIEFARELRVGVPRLAGHYNPGHGRPVGVSLECLGDGRDKFYYGDTSTLSVVGKVITVFEQHPSSYKDAQFYQFLIDGQLMWAIIYDSWFDIGIITHISGV